MRKAIFKLLICFFVGFLCAYHSCLGAKPTSEEILEIEANLPEQDSIQLLASYRLLANHYKFVNTALAKTYSDKGFALATQLNDPSYQTVFLYTIGNILTFNGQYIEALDTLHFGLEIAKEQQDTCQFEFHNSLGILSQYLNQQTAAIEHYQDAIDYASQIGAQCKSFYPLGNMANLYRKRKEFKKSRDFLNRALDYALQCGDPLMRAYAFKDLSYLFIQTNQLDTATLYAQMAIEEAESIKNSYILSDTYVNLSIIKRLQSQYEQAIELGYRALDLANTVGTHQYKVRAYQCLTEAFLATNQFEEAQLVADKHLNIILSSDMKDEMVNGFQLLQTVHASQGKYQSAFELQSIIDSLKESQFDQNLQQYITHAEYKFNSQVEEAVVQRIKAETRRDRIQMLKSGVFTISLYIFALLVGFIMYLFFLQNIKGQDRPTFDPEIASNEIDIRSNYARQISLVGFVLVAFSIIYLYFWAELNAIILAIVPLSILGLTYIFSRKKWIVPCFIVGLFYYPYFIISAYYFPINSSVVTFLLTIFVVMAYLSYKSWMHIVNGVVLLSTLILRFYLKDGFLSQSIMGMETLSGIIAFSVFFITISYFNRNIYVFKNAFLKNHQFLKQISNINPNFVFAKDINRKFTFVNLAIAKVFGFDLNYFYGKTNESIPSISKSDDKFREEDELVLETGQTIFSKNVQITPLDGIERWYDIIKKPIYNEEDEVVGLLGVSTEVTERVKAEEALQATKRRFQTLIEASPNAVVTLTLDGIVKYASPKTHDLFGYETITGKSVYEFVDPSHHHKLKDCRRRVIEDKEPIVHTQIVGIKENGTHLFIEGYTKLIQFERNAPPQLLLVFNDVSEKIEVQKVLKERHMIYETLITGAFDAIDIVEIQSFDDLENIKGRVIIRNDMMAYYARSKTDLMIYGGDLVNISPTYQLNGDPSAEMVETYFQSFMQNNHVQFEWSLYLESGEIVILDVLKQLIKVNDKLLIIRVARDITTQRKQRQIIHQQLADMRHQKQELEKYIASNLELENFAYIASHDLRAPLRTIISFSQLLTRSMNQRLSEKEAEYLNFIVRSSQNMNALINDLLTYSKVNNTQLRPEVTVIKDLIMEVVADLKSIIEENAAEVQITNLPNQIIADPTKIRRLFLNILTNAIKFAKPDSKPYIEIGCRETNTHWEFYVQDNGIGIGPEYHESIFLLFKRLHSTHTYEGTGIGLALCKKIISQHQGTIWLSSKVNVGTTFYFTISKLLTTTNAVELERGKMVEH